MAAPRIAPRVIDADSHVYEVDETWSALPSEFQSRRPLGITLDPKDVPYMMPMNAFWLIDARVVNPTWGRGCVQVGTPLSAVHAKRKAFSPGSQSLMDVDARLADLDRAGVDVQVIFPSLCVFVTLSEDDAFETALLASYNAWIAKRCAERPDRLKWVAAISLRQPVEAAREVRRAKELGAVGVMIGGSAGETLLHARAFDPGASSRGSRRCASASSRAAPAGCRGCCRASGITTGCRATCAEATASSRSHRRSRTSTAAASSSRARRTSRSCRRRSSTSARTTSWCRRTCRTWRTVKARAPGSLRAPTCPTS